MSCFRRRKTPTRSVSCPVSLPTIRLEDWKTRSAPVLARLPGLLPSKLVLLISPYSELSFVEEDQMLGFLSSDYTEHYLTITDDMVLFFNQEQFTYSTPALFPWSCKDGNITATRLFRYLTTTSCVFNDVTIGGNAILMDGSGDFDLLKWEAIHTLMKTRQIRATNGRIPIKRYVYQRQPI